VKRWALAYCKDLVGRVRTKYTSFAGAQGATQLDGDRLIQEAVREFEQLEKEIAASAYPMSFLVG
jgi:hypothetical protein